MEPKSVVRIAGKQYLVKKGDELVVDKIDSNVGDEVSLELLLHFSQNDDKAEVGTPTLTRKGKASVIEHLKGDKLYVQKFKSKVRYRKRMGFRPQLTKLKIISV